MNSRVNYFIKNTGIFLLGSFGSKFLSFLLLPLYTSILSTSQYGQVDLVSTTQSLLFPLITLGLSEAIFRFAMNKDIESKGVLSNSIFIVSFSYVCTFFLALAGNIFLKWPYMHWMLAILACSIAYEVLTNYLKANKDSRKYVMIGVIHTFVNLLGNILLLVVFKLGVEGFLIAICVSYLIPSIVVFFREKIYKEVRIAYFDKQLAVRMLRYSLPLIFTSLSWWIVTSSDKYMIRYFMGDSEVGIYSIASKIPLILQTLISILQTVWQISTNQMHDEEPENLKENFVLFTKAFRQTGFIAGSALIVLAQPLMMILARNDFYSGWIYAPFLILSIVFSFATGMVSTLYGAYEKNAGVLYSVLVGAGLNIVINALLIPRIGIMGATIATAVSRFIIAIYRLKDTERLLEYDREYGVIAVDCMLITVQCVLLITMRSYVYPVQLVCLTVICIYNREIFTKGLRYILGILRRSRNA